VFALLGGQRYPVPDKGGAVSRQAQPLGAVDGCGERAVSVMIGGAVLVLVSGICSEVVTESPLKRISRV
jgi:hypothetical protein